MLKILATKEMNILSELETGVTIMSTLGVSDFKRLLEVYFFKAGLILTLSSYSKFPGEFLL